MRVLLTGGSGFIAAHVLNKLLEHGHSVVTTVRSQEKGQKILGMHDGLPKEKLNFAVVEDVADIHAFDEVVISKPPFDAVVHTASPLRFDINDIQKDYLDPAINGTAGLLRAVKRSAPSVQRVVITSSFGAIIDTSKPPSTVFSERDWDPITLEEATLSNMNGYNASKTFAEKAAWDFIKEEHPNFSLATINPPMVMGPVVHYIKDLSALNASNQSIRDLISGAGKDGCPRSNAHLWVDVRDLAVAHVLAMEKPEAANQRFFITAGTYSNKEIAELIWDGFPELRDKLPTGDALKSGDYPAEGWFGYDNRKSKEMLGMTYMPLRESIVDAVKSLKPHLGY